MIMVQTAGQKLQAARGKRRLSLDDASRATKIRTRQLADLERDEYSNFPNLAYAKGFLISYGKYLEVDVRPYLDAFEDANTFGLDNYQYLSEVPLGVYRATRRPARRRNGRRRYVMTAAALGVMALAFVGWQVYVSYERLGDLDKLADSEDAREHSPAAPTSAAQPSPAAAPIVAGAPIAGDTPPAGPNLLRNAVADPSARGSHPPALPLPGDGGALRNLVAATNAGQPPFFMMYGAPGPQSSPPESGGTEHGSWSPENLDGYRFYVRIIDSGSVEIFRSGVPRPETVLNNPL